MATNLLPHAVNAVNKHGWHVFPCAPGEKQGMYLYPNKPWRIRWYEEATDDLDKVISRWQVTPACNVGISCKKSGLLVVDCDYDAATGADGVEQFENLVRHSGQSWGATTDTYTVVTPSGGAHYYYQWPHDVHASQASLDSHLDVRTNGGEKGGYVLGAGSVTPKGDYQAVNDKPVAWVPMWLMRTVEDKPRPKPVSSYRQPASVSYTGLQESLATAHEGNRNYMLHWAACAMAEDDQPVEFIEHVLTQPAEHVGLHPQEIQATIRSAHRQVTRRHG